MSEVAKLLFAFSKVSKFQSSRLSLGFYDGATGNHAALILPGDSPVKIRQLLYDFLTFLSMSYEIPCDFVLLKSELGL